MLIILVIVFSNNNVKLICKVHHSLCLIMCIVTGTNIFGMPTIF